jgi:polar amino acid transport system substrate-binding protein
MPSRTAPDSVHGFQSIRGRFNRVLCGFFIAFLWLAAPALAQPPSLRFTTQAFAPFDYEADGKVIGPATEIVAAACGRAGIICSFAQLPWARAQSEVRDGEANGMFVIGWSKERAEWLHFAPPLMKTEYGFFAQAGDRTEYRDLADVQGWSIATYGPSNTSETLEGLRERMIARQLQPFTIDLRPGDEDGFRKLALSRVKAVFSNRDVGFAVVKRLGLRADIRYAGKTSELNYYVGFSKKYNDPAILARFDEAVTALAASGKIQRILEPYDMQPADPRLEVARLKQD